MVLIKEIKFSGKSIKELAQEYNISLSTLYNIKNQSEHYLEGKSRRKYTEIDYSDKLFICDLISGFVIGWRKPYTWSDLSRYINHNSEVDVPYHKIREIVKSRFNMTYKRINSRSRCYANKTIFSARCLFSVKFTNTVDENHLIINIDEWSIGRACKANYSWGVKGSNIECQNINSVGSTNLIMAICSNGCWFWMTTRDSIDSKYIFIVFRKIGMVDRLKRKLWVL